LRQANAILQLGVNVSGTRLELSAAAAAAAGPAFCSFNQQNNVAI